MFLQSFAKRASEPPVPPLWHSGAARPLSNARAAQLRSFRLTGWFALLSFLCIATISVVSSLLLSRFLTANLLRHDAQNIMEAVQGIVEGQDPRAYFRAGSGAGHGRSLEDFFSRIAKLPDVLRANIYARDQTVLWSSDASLIGRNLGANRELEEALLGDIRIESGPLGATDAKPEHSMLPLRGARYVENYLPVRATPGGEVIGAVELYRIPTALSDAIERGVQLIWASAIAGGLLLYGVLFGLVRRADRVLDEQRQRLLEAETLAVIGEMTAAIAHGVRNPLASIRTSAELLHDDAAPDVRDAARDIVAEVDRLSEWVRQLLTYSDEHPTCEERIDVAVLLRATLDGFSREMQRIGVVSEVDLEPMPAIRAEPVRLAHAFNSLVANALEAMRGGGVLAVEAAPTADRRFVQIRIRDTGDGVPSEHLPRIFAPFFTTKAKGLGLGLPLVRRIITRFGGSIAMTSEPGRGSTVYIELPV